jgi:DNA-binding response OmpR family regulator
MEVLPMAEIWVVEDEKNIRELIRRYLEKEGFTVRLFNSSEAIETALVNHIPDMFILDIMLPGDDGLTLCRKIRESHNTPIIFVSARGEEFDRVLGLELGADDYLAKPFSPRELVLRVKTIFRRLQSSEDIDKGLNLKNVTISPEQRKVSIDGEEVFFTEKEYELFSLLASHPGRPFSRQHLLEKVWGFDYEGEDRAVDNTVKRIRKKIRDKEALPELSTVWGFGYKLDV